MSYRKIARRRRFFLTISDDFTPGNHIFLLHKTFEISKFPRPYRERELPPLPFERCTEWKLNLKFENPFLFTNRHFSSLIDTFRTHRPPTTCCYGTPLVGGQSPLFYCFFFVFASFLTKNMYKHSISIKTQNKNTV